MTSIEMHVSFEMTFALSRERQMILAHALMSRSSCFYLILKSLYSTYSIYD